MSSGQPIIKRIALGDPDVSTGFPVSKYHYYLNYHVIFPPLMVMVILKMLDFKQTMTVTLGLATYIYYVMNYYQEYNKKLKLLKNILYDGFEEPFETESFLEYDPKIIDFFYRIRYYVDDNLTSFRKSLEACNNVLRYSWNLNQNLMKYPEQLYKNAYFEYKQALNELHSVIYKLTSQEVNNDIYNDNLLELKSLLDKHMKKIKNVIKCDYNTYDINIYSLINPSNIEMADDTKDKYYSPHFSFF